MFVFGSVSAEPLGRIYYSTSYLRLIMNVKIITADFEPIQIIVWRNPMMRAAANIAGFMRLFSVHITTIVPCWSVSKRTGTRPRSQKASKMAFFGSCRRGRLLEKGYVFWSPSHFRVDKWIIPFDVKLGFFSVDFSAIDSYPKIVLDNWSIVFSLCSCFYLLCFIKCYDLLFEACNSASCGIMTKNWRKAVLADRYCYDTNVLITARNYAAVV